MKKDSIGGGVIVLVSTLGILKSINIIPYGASLSDILAGFIFTISLIGILLGVLFAFGMWRRLRQIGGGKGGITAVFDPETDQPESIAQVEKSELAPEEKAEKQVFASKLRLPTIDAPPFRVLTEKSIAEMGLWPGADPSVPMYSLGKDYRILDWNKAFSLAFSRSMEGHGPCTQRHC